MSLVEIIFLALALGIDCLVVSFSQGLIFKTNRLRNSFALAVSMGFFQGFMPCVGYLGTSMVSKYIEPYGKWLVFIIFMALGVKFIYEAFGEKEEKVCCINWKCLVGMGIATSIDALAAGVSVHLTQTSLLPAILVIGAASSIMAVCGYWLGVFFKYLPSKFLEIFGGLVLIFLAIKNLYL